MFSILLAALSICLCGQPPSGSAPAATQPQRPETQTAAWLVDLARHHGHMTGRLNPRRVTLAVLALMKGATEIAPDYADAWLWQYDLLARMGRDDEALAALSRYVTLDPTDESAALQQLALSLRSLQTAEARGAYLAKRLKEPNLPRSLASDIHRRLAEFYRERNQTDLASQQIAEALRLMPLNLPAREMAYEMFGETEPLLQRVEMALQLVTMNPSQVNVLWELAELLDSYSMHNEAVEWYGRAIEIHRRATREPIAAERLVQVAMAQADAGKFDASLKTIDDVLALKRNDVPTRLLRAFVSERAAAADPAKRKALLEAARADLAAATADADGRIDSVLKSKDTAAATDLAWFFAVTAPDKEKALTLADLAIAGSQVSSMAHRAHGFALLLNDRVREAADELAPLAEADQMAAYGLGKALLAQGKRNEAISALQRGAHMRYSGMAFERIAEVLRTLGEAPPQPPSHPKVTEALARFDRRVFDFFMRPSDTLRLTLQALDESVPVAGPCRVRIRLQNINPPGSFSVTLGDGLMVRPRVMLSALLGGRDGRRYPNYTEVLLNRRPVLAPGESIERIVSIDVGPLHEELITRAILTQQIELSALLDPVKRGASYLAGLGSVYGGPIQITRPGLPTDAGAIGAIVRDASSARADVRIGAAEKLGALLAARDRTGVAFPAAAALESTGAQDALLLLANDRDWTVRAHALEAIRWGRMNARLLGEKLDRTLQDESAVVRLLAVRLFGLVQPEQFAGPLASFAKTDPSPAVRLMARSFIISGDNQDTVGTAARPLDDANP